MYQKEIIYMGLYKDGNRIGNAGFLKVENREAESRLDLKLKNLPLTIRGRFPIRIHNGAEWKEVNGITVQEGGGSWAERMVDPAKQVQIQITFPEGYFLEGRSKGMPEERRPVVTGEEAGTEKIRQKPTENTQDSGLQKRAEEEQNNGLQKRAEEEQNSGLQKRAEEEQNSGSQKRAEEEQNSGLQKRVEEQNNGSQKRAEEERNSGSQKLAEEIQDSRPEPRKTVLITEELKRPEAHRDIALPSSLPETPAGYSLKEDKWEQILDSYEQIHPYGDERVYVKLEPRDFIILQSGYQHLVNNSFLLHGFYNYRYVILGKEQDFYLGVPGVFYEREKMVALMFGFEAFECPGGIARAGEFGYYLRKVEL